LRVVTEPRVLRDGRAEGCRVLELALQNCLRGSLVMMAPHLCKLNHLKILHLSDNANLTGALECIRFSNLPHLEQLSLQCTSIETNRGFSMLTPCLQLKYVDVTGCRRVTGAIPQSLQNHPGLLLNIQGSGLEGQDDVGNEARSRLRWGKKHLAKIPGAARAP